MQREIFKRWVITLWTVIGSLLFPLLCPAGGLQPLTVNFDKNTYKADRQNWNIAQSPEGYMYFANSRGLLEYDGADWSLYPLPQRQVMRAVACDTAGRIFVGGYSEFGYWQRNDHGVLAYTSLSNRLAGESLGREVIWHILITEEGVFFQSFSAIYRFSGGAVKRLHPPGESGITLMYLQQIGNRLFLPVIGLGILELTETGDFRFLPGSERFADLTISFMLELPGGMLLGTQQDGVFRWDGRRFTPWPTPLQPRFMEFGLNKGIRLHDGRLALGTLRDGVYLCDENGVLLRHFSQENGLQNNTVLALMEDDRQHLWIGLARGIDMLALQSPLRFFQDRSGNLGTPWTAIVSQGNLYIGTNQGVYYCSWPMRKGDRFRLIRGTQGQVWQLEEFGGQLLCGHNAGTFRIQNGRAEKISSVTGGWSFLSPPGRSGLLLQGTYSGLAIFENHPEEGWRLRGRVKGFHLPAKKLIAGPAGAVWAVHPNEGLYRLAFSAGMDAVVEQQRIGPGYGLPSDFGIELVKVRGELLAISGEELLQWLQDIQQFEPHPLPSVVNDGRTNLKVYAGSEREWFLSNELGTLWLDADRLIGHLPLELTPNSAFVKSLTDSLYFFGLENGFALLDRTKPPATQTPDKPVIKSISAIRQGRTFFITPPRKSDGGGLPLPARVKQLQFRFAMPYYLQPPLFRYRLRPDGTWSDWSEAPIAVFNQLAPGDYIFELQSYYHAETVRQPFSIQPPWYLTSTSVAIYCLTAAGLLFLLYRWHRSRLRKQQEQLNAERLRQLEEERVKAKAEKLESEVINKSKKLANSTFNIIRKNEVLLQVKEELRQLKNKPGVDLPNKEMQNLTHLIDRHLNNDQDWEVFESNFNQVHQAFLKRLKNAYPELSPGDLKLAAYLRMNLTSKEIAPLLNISVRGVEIKRYRLRKKLDLPSEQNLTEFILGF